VSGSTQGIQLGGDVGQEPTEPGHLNVVDGSPVARHLDMFGVAGDSVTVNLWDCTAGTTAWYYHTDEIVHILEGEVSIEDEQGRVFELRAGDVAHFALGTRLVWTVPDYVKKLALHRRPTPWEQRRRRLRRVAGKLAGRRP
jgi:uncharacterized cupin superfamily protein